MDQIKPDTDDPDMAAIRGMMQAQGTPPAPPQPTAQASPVDTPRPAPQPRAPQQEPDRAVSHAPKPRAKTRKESKAKARATSLIRKAMTALSLRIHAFVSRPDAPRMMALAMLVVVFIWRPGFVVGMAVLALLIAAIVYFSLGPERVAQMVAAWHGRLAARDPDRAEVLRLRAAWVSKRIATLVNRLPNRWTAGLYLPDFEPEGEMPEAMDNDPFDRLVPQSELT
ncbi:hypothetical protein [Aliiroseovarius subalbicans]|uniref:hypothetical protein n=1 Tax=Aliiroseovarius subalbicans TaxID=2925840 RepID=UPI001F5827C8|nr:hypothetical protein [Aliiroseovarius subalbicans]MCI2399845.1 hypothetical protein [Aliiroseovarius subalbicans]